MEGMRYKIDNRGFTVNILKTAALLIVAAFLSGCSVAAPKYTVNYADVVSLKEGHLQKVSVGKAAKANNNVEGLTIRGSSYQSPYGSFSEYLKAALQEDLDHAELLDSHASTELTCTLVRNVLDGSGFSVGFAEIEATLAVKRDGSVLYERAKSIRHEWPSSFAGAVAIPRAAQNYPIAVRKLLGEFYADPDFLAALR